MIRNDFYGNQYKWFVGIVKDILGGNAVRVRIIGIHHIEDEVKISDKDLPIAYVMYPVDYSNLHTFKEGDWVHGFFLDGDNCQQPVVTGIFTGGGIQGQSRAGSGELVCGQDYTTNLVGIDVAQKVWNFFVPKFESVGAINPEAAAAGILGNFDAESSMNPEAINPNGGASGLAQWFKSRRSKLFNYAKEKTGNKENWKRLDVQLNFTWYELQTTQRKAFSELKSANDPRSAVEAFLHFEKPEFYNARNVTGSALYSRRVAVARQYYNLWKNGTQPGPASETPAIPTPVSKPTGTPEPEDSRAAQTSSLLPV